MAGKPAGVALQTAIIATLACRAWCTTETWQLCNAYEADEPGEVAVHVGPGLFLSGFCYKILPIPEPTWWTSCYQMQTYTNAREFSETICGPGWSVIRYEYGSYRGRRPALVTCCRGCGNINAPPCATGYPQTTTHNPGCQRHQLSIGPNLAGCPCIKMYDNGNTGGRRRGPWCRYSEPPDFGKTPLRPRDEETPSVSSYGGD